MVDSLIFLYTLEFSWETLVISCITFHSLRQGNCTGTSWEDIFTLRIKQDILFRERSNYVAREW